MREEGYYWVKPVEKSEWLLCWWDGIRFEHLHSYSRYTDKNMFAIDETRILPPQN